MKNLKRKFSLVPGLVAAIAFSTVVVISPASAQQPNVQKYGEPDKEKTPAEKAAEKEAQRAYQRSLGNIPAQQNTDPWGIARGDSGAAKDAAKPAAKTASPKPKAKTDATKSADSKTGAAAK